MQITRIKSGRRSKTCYKRAIFTELQQITNYAKLIAKGQLSCWNTTNTCARHGELLGRVTPVDRSRSISSTIKFLSSALKQRDLVAIGRHSGAKLWNRLAGLTSDAATALTQYVDFSILQHQALNHHSE